MSDANILITEVAQGKTAKESMDEFIGKTMQKLDQRAAAKDLKGAKRSTSEAYSKAYLALNTLNNMGDSKKAAELKPIVAHLRSANDALEKMKV
jgi:hypothetical protein